MSARERADEILGRYREALDRGEDVDPEQVIRLHPEIADDLRVRFAALRLLDRAYRSARSEPADAPPSAAVVGGRLGRDRLLRELGAGGMGTVYLARVEEASPPLPEGAMVALKVIHPHLPSRPGFVRRFRREAQAGRRVRHENVVPTYDMDAVEKNGHTTLFLAMEYVEGRTLRELLRDLEVLPEALTRELLVQVAAGLRAIHDAGVVHRDLKPENVLVTDDHEVRIMDEVEKAGGILHTQHRTFAPAKRKCEANMEVCSGWQIYIHAAPEQFQSGRVGPTADLYAVGVLLYELASGENPFRRSSTLEVINAHMHHRPPRLAERCPGVSPFLSELATQLLAKDPADRIATAAELHEVLVEGENGAWWTERSHAVTLRTRRLPQLPVRRDTRLYGRAAELQRVGAAWEAVQRRHGRTVLVVGEAGIGKTRFLDAFLHTIEHEDVTALYGQYATTSGLGGLSEALLGHFGQTGLEEALQPYLRETPGLVAPFASAVLQAGVPEGHAPLAADAGRTVLVNLARALAEERPLVWILEDLHLASRESRQLVLALARALQGHRILLLLTADPQLARDDVANLTRLDNFERIDLGRLSPREVVELLRDAFRSEVLAEKLGVKVAFKSDGVPLFILEMVRSLKDDGFIARAEDGSFTLSRAVEAIDVPDVVRDLIDARLRELSKEEREILDVGSAQGFEFDADLVARVLDRKRVAVLQDLAEIERRLGLVKAAGRAYQFDHHQIQEVVYEDLNEGLRSEYHTLLAEARGALEEGTPTPGGEAAAFLASHHLRGRTPREASPFLPAALGHLLGTYRHEAAIDLAQRALAEHALLAGADRIHTLERVADGYDLLGRWDEEQQALEEAVALVDATGDDARRATLRNRLGTVLVRLARWSPARDVFDRAMSIARRAGDQLQEGRAASGLGDIWKAQGLYEPARAHYERALAHAEAVEDTRGVWLVAQGLGGVARGQGRIEEAETHLRKAVAFARDLGDRRDVAQAAATLANVLSVSGRYDEAMGLHEQALEACHEVGYRLGEGRATGNLGNLLVRLGRFDEALRGQQRALAIARETGDRRGEAVGLANLGNVLLHVDRLEEAREHFEHYLMLSREALDRDGECFAQGRLGIVFRQLGDGERALDHFEQTLALARMLRDRGAEGAATGNAGLTLTHLGRYAEAERHLVSALELARALGDKRSEGTALADLGTLLLAVGDHAAARQHLEASLALAHPMGDQRGEAIAKEGLGRAALLAERTDEAREHFKEARLLARDIGARRREGLATLGLGFVMEREGRTSTALRQYEIVHQRGMEIHVPMLEVLGVAHAAALSVSRVADAERALDVHGSRIAVADRVEAIACLWRATGDRRRLAEAWELIEWLRRNAPPARRASVVDGIPLHRAIRDAWAAPTP